MKQTSLDDLLSRLKEEGKNIKNSELAEAINGIAFKLLEKIRMGQRDEVIYLLLRTFTAKERKLPECLLDVLKEKYDDTQFKCLLYAFLAPILGEKEKEGGES